MTSMIREAAEAIRAGKLIIFPTDTVYGIGCDPFNRDAVALLYSVKHRPLEKSIPLLVNSIRTAKSLGKLSPVCEELIEKHWPGALTIVVQQETDALLTLSHDGTIALRMPDHEDLLELIICVGGAIAATSANISGKPPILTYDEVYAAFADTVEVILPGKVREETSSTLIDCTGKAPVVLREGPVVLK